MTSSQLHRRDLLQGLLASLAIGCSVSERERTDRPNDGDQKTGPQPDPHHTDPDVKPPGPVDEEAAMDIAKRIDSFAFDFWGQLGKSSGNLVYSPASIALSLARRGCASGCSPNRSATARCARSRGASPPRRRS